MNVRKGIALAAATAALAGGVALAPAANAAPVDPAVTQAAGVSAQVTWYPQWRSTISADYLNSHGKKWVSGAYRQPTWSTMARGTFRCSGGGEAELRILDVDRTKNTAVLRRKCNGAKHYVTIPYERNHHIKLILTWKSGKVSDTIIEAWAG